MRLMHAVFAVVLGTVVVAGGTALAGSDATVARKQRIAIDGVIMSNKGTGTFALSPLTPGPLKADRGTVALLASEGGPHCATG
jgi:hypothetical protein